MRPIELPLTEEEREGEEPEEPTTPEPTCSQVNSPRHAHSIDQTDQMWGKEWGSLGRQSQHKHARAHTSHQHTAHMDMQWVTGQCAKVRMYGDTN
jgi:hypothetical protein